MGFSIDLGMVVITRMYFGKVFHMIHCTPHWLRQYAELKRKFTQTQEFLDKADIQENYIQRVENSEYAMQVKGNFSWGFTGRNENNKKEESFDIN